MRICKTLGEDSQGFERLWERIRKDSWDFGRGFREQGFARLWERIRKDSQDFWRGFTRIRETLGEDS